MHVVYTVTLLVPSISSLLYTLLCAPWLSYQWFDIEHRLMEYAYMSSRAADERSKRPNYRPILDYDSLPSNRGQNQVISIMLGMVDLVLM